MATVSDQVLQCAHCGEDCITGQVRLDDKVFCCDGCRMVYSILNSHGMCEYYQMNDRPGISRKNSSRPDKFAFLDDENIQRQLTTFRDDRHTHVTFYLPQIHCSSCLWVLEHLHKLNEAVISSKVNFARKEVTIVFDHGQSSLRKIAELLTSIGYEPYISLNDLKNTRPRINKSMVLQLGIAGFCFGNIMLLSFPEYLGIEHGEKGLLLMFRYLSLVLSLPVVLYSAAPFYRTAWGGLKQRFLNMDAAIVLAIFVTFFRSAYEVISATGSGYFDSLSGIVFFMLIGRVLQDRTYQQLSFDRDYTSYFPIAVTVLKGDEKIPTALPDIRPGDTILIHHQELVPADGILTRGKAWIDYSFVTGESLPVTKEMGEIVYAGGKQTGSNMELLVIKEVSQSYLASLWERDAFKSARQEDRKSFVQSLARYFTVVVLTIALTAGLYWWQNDPSRIWYAVTAVLIVACPCALLLSNTFTNGNILRILSHNKFYLRNAQVIENIASANQIVFDKTGTLTSNHEFEIVYNGVQLTDKQKYAISSLAAQSSHPLSRALTRHLLRAPALAVQGFLELPGKGIEGFVGNDLVAVGSKAYITGIVGLSSEEGTRVYVAIEDTPLGYFQFGNQYREEAFPAIRKLKESNRMAIISGDSPAERRNLQYFFGSDTTLLFRQQPEDKLHYIQSLQQKGNKVIMIGDGLNDAGALKQSDAGIAVSEDTNNFTPSSDAILAADELPKLDRFIRLCKANKKIVIASFILSILYNIAGLYFAVQGTLSPLIAAILMPASSISILLLTFGSSNLAAKRLKLNV
ncbi:MAG TPA: heavy metal translocating P-type ATPase metal-binding domain-containing protein [Chitinophagaceae bacterium]